MKETVTMLLQSKSDAHVKRYVDNVKLGVDGWKMRYYAEKFDVKTEEEFHEFTRKIK